MRICGDKRRLHELGDAKERPQAHRMSRERVHPALLAVDHAHRRAAYETGLAQGFHGGDRGAAGGDDVLDEAGQRARLEDALEPVLGAVALGLLADDHEGKLGGERRRGGQDDGAELGTREERRVGLVFYDLKSCLRAAAAGEEEPAAKPKRRPPKKDEDGA